MTTIGTPTTMAGNNAVASPQKPSAASQDRSNARAFAEILKDIGSPAPRGEPLEAASTQVKPHGVEIPSQEHLDGEANAEAKDEQKDPGLQGPSGHAQLPPFALGSTAAQSTLPAFVAAGRTHLNEPTHGLMPAGSSLAAMALTANTAAENAGHFNQTTLRDMQGGSVPARATAQWAPTQLSVPEVDRAVGGSGRLMAETRSGQAMPVPSGTAPSIRHETHLLAAEGPAAAVTLLGSAGQHANHENQSLEVLAARSAGEAIADVVSKDSTDGAADPIASQIAGQVASAWTPLRGAPSLEMSESTAPSAAAGRPTVAGSDVVKTLRFDLHPGELGEVHVRMSISGNELRLHLSFSADRAAGIAQAEGHELMQALSDGGMNLSQLVIDSTFIPRTDPQGRQDGSTSQATLAGGSMTDGSGTGREHHAQHESARRPSLPEHSTAEIRMPRSEKAGIFI